MCVSAVPAALLMDTRTLLVFILVLALVVFASMMAMPAIERRLNREGLRARWLGRAAWTRVPLRPVHGGPLEGAGQLPTAFMLLSQNAGDHRLWMSRRGLRRLWSLLDAPQKNSRERPELRWKKGRAEVAYKRKASESDRYLQDIVVLRRNDARLYPVEPALGVVERADVGQAVSDCL